ncbi:hypothetical protein [Pseudoalteromonas sp. APC 3694]|uniref:hypothetical protein n=1 Tax=Pseudoalteromonas sp. APC 3694 TaxID=3035202 RepID=UPI0025B538D3|nr:hypothetical protein [Pseudoalteromonas sp. APC 3694]MDN3490577.1 hypothetical protein [Pseudoalteromonas sp. APC 3694]
MKTIKKYDFDGQQLGVGRLILAIMKKYVEENNPTFEQLKNDFKEVEEYRTKSKPLYITHEDLEEVKRQTSYNKKRFFESSDESLKLSDHTLIYVSNQWSGKGVRSISTDKFIEFVNSKFDYGITDVVEHKSINDLYNDYLKKPNKGWIAAYERFSAEVEQNLDSDASNYETDFIEKLWKSESNGIASAKPGTLSNDEYKNLLDDLPEITALIFKDPTPNTLEEIYKWAGEAKKEGKFNTVKRGVIHRVFAAADPKKYNTILNVDGLRAFTKYLNDAFDLGINVSWNWAELNQVVTEKIKSKVDKPENELVFNTFIWWLFEKLKKESDDENLYIDEDETDPSMASKLNKSEKNQKILFITAHQVLVKLIPCKSC